MGERRRIPTPLKRRWQQCRTRLVPLAAWLGAAAIAAMLWNQRTSRLDAPGMVEARQAVVAPVERGTLTHLVVELFDAVRAAQVVARLDDTAVRAALGVAQAEVRRLEAALRAAERQLKQELAAQELDWFTSTRNYAMRMEQLRLDKLDRTIQLENDQVELQRLAAILDRAKTLRHREVIADQDLDDVRFQHQALQKKIEATKEALAVIQGRMREALARERKPQAPAAAEGVEVALAPFREALTVQLKRIDEIRAQREALVLASPLDGVVTAVYRREGEAVMRGEPVLTVADPRSMRIVSFVEAGKAVEPTAGMVVEVRRRTRPVQVARARVVKVSPQVEEIPPPIRRNPALAAWGVRVLIDVPWALVGATASSASSGPLRPGELLDVRYFVSPPSSPSWSRRAPPQVERSPGG